MRTIYIMSGVPGSGKSTYIDKHKGQYDLVARRDNWRTRLRESMNSKDYFPVPANQEWEMWIAFLNGLLESANQTVWIDQTTLGHGALDKLLSALFLTENDNIVIVKFELDYETIQERNALRTGLEFVPENRLQSMYKSHIMKPIDEDAISKILSYRNSKCGAFELRRITE